jgi:protein-tyrosine-phosphatase
MPSGRLYPELEKYIEKLTCHYNDIPEIRKKDLKKIRDFITQRIKKGGGAFLTFICTHNSRRSHMGQIWAQTASYFFEIPDVKTFSGGTEASAFNPNAIDAMQNAGFRINPDNTDKNTLYSVLYAMDQPALKVFSKRYDDVINPDRDFCAIMTCSDADENCPIIPGAALRIPITYEDPKAYDHTERDSEAYEERCFQIGVEMFYLFSRIKVD